MDKQTAFKIDQRTVPRSALDGVVVDKLVSNQLLTAGRHQYSTTINKSGTYLVVYKHGSGDGSLTHFFVNSLDDSIAHAC